MNSFVLALWFIHGGAVVFVMWVLRIAYPRSPRRNALLYWATLSVCGFAWWLVFLWSLGLICKDFFTYRAPYVEEEHEPYST